ncbi:proton-coupled folate transporter-like isoform X2 [Palaemon carinicauda]
MWTVTVEPVVFLYNIADTVQMSVQQDFIFYRLCSQNYSEEVCRNSKTMGQADKLSGVQAEAVKRVMWISVVTGILAVLMSQILGLALDRYSRKVVMLIPFIGSLGLSLICLLVAANPVLSLDILYVGAALRGLAGGFVVFKSSVSSYVVNLADVEERTKRLAVVEAMLYLGSAVGPLCLQILMLYGTQNHSYLFMSCEFIIIAALLYIITFLPDYVVQRDIKPPTPVINNNIADICADYQSVAVRISIFTKRCGVLQSFVNALAVTFRKRKPGIRGAIIMLFVADFFIAIVFAAEFDLLYLYMQDKLGFTLPQFSQYQCFKNLVNGISLLFLLPFLRKFFGLGDTTLGILGGISRNAAFLLIAFNTSPQWIYLAPVLDIFGQYLFVVLRSIISSLVKENEQGRVLTVMSSMAQLSLLLGSALFDSAYPQFLRIHQPGLTFVLAAISMGISATMLSIIHCHLTSVRKREELQPLLE